jgi:hypothetical protein
MEKEKLFFIDSLNLMPNDSICFIQAPNLESIEIKSVLKATEYPHYVSLQLNSSNLYLLCEKIINEDIQEDIQAIEIRHNGKLLFKGFDSVEYGTISKDVILPNEYIENYINEDFCNISENW